MLVKGIMTQMSGSVGGITGSHNRGGLYLRARSIPVDPASVRQQVMRAAAAALASRWRDELTPSQRQAWAAYAANTPIANPLGDARDVGGLPMYIRGNSIRIQIGEDPVDDPAISGLPTLSPAGPPTISAATGTLVVPIKPEAWASTPDAFLAVYASRPISETIGFWKGPYRLIGSIEGNSSTPPTDFTGSYGAVWGQAGQGAQVRLQLRVVDDFGALSAPVRRSLIIGA